MNIDILPMFYSALIGVVAVLAILAVSTVLRTAARLALQKLFPTGAVYVAGVLQFAVLIGGLYALAINAGVDPTVILAIIAIITAGAAIAGESTFAEIMAGLKIVATRRFSVGEYVTLAGDISGRVTEIGLFSTTVEVSSRGLVTLSNRKVADDTIINHDRLGGVEMSCVIPMYDEHDIDLALGTVVSVMTSVEGIHPRFKALYGWGAGGPEYAVVFRVLNYSQRREMKSYIEAELTKAFIANGLPIGYVSFYKGI